jgi:hypothetical protein
LFELQILTSRSSMDLGTHLPLSLGWLLLASVSVASKNFCIWIWWLTNHFFSRFTEFLYILFQFATSMRGKKNAVSVVFLIHLAVTLYYLGEPFWQYRDEKRSIDPSPTLSRKQPLPSPSPSSYTPTTTAPPVPSVTHPPVRESLRPSLPSLGSTSA